MLIVSFVLWLLNWAMANECTAASIDDELEVYLLTSGPGDGIYTKVGHSALWVSGDGQSNTVLNWGAYDESQDFFLWKFFMGTATYHLFMMHPTRNIARVKGENQKLLAQHLQLSPIQKEKLKTLIAHHSLPENRSYIYHWEQQNCATLIRDIINEVSNGALENVHFEDLPSRRTEVLRHMYSTAWLWFGWHFMASDYADTTYEEKDLFHIPIRLMEAASKATIQWEDGTQKPLVDKSCVFNEGQGWAIENPKSRGLELWSIGLLIGLCALPWVQKRIPNIIHKSILTVFLAFSGLLSTFFMMCWCLSELDGYGFNENWFFAHPLHLLGIVGIWKAPPKWLRYLQMSWLILIIVGLLWKGIDSNVQDNWDIIGLFAIPAIFMSAQQFKAKKIDMIK